MDDEFKEFERSSIDRPKEPYQIKIGDIVKIRSGSPKMTVETINNNLITCIFFEGKTLKKIPLLEHTLEVMEF